MPLFRRKRQSVPDSELPFLGEEDAQQLRALVREAFAEHGLEVTVHPDYVADAEGRQFGLWNVAAACHNDERGRRAWGEVVRTHVAIVLAAMDAPDPFESLTAEDAAARTYARVYEVASMPGLEDRPHVEIAPGLVGMLALDLPESVAVYGREEVDRLGGWQRLWEAGLANLRREEVEQHERVDGPDGARFDVVLGESVYTASTALLLPEQLSRLTGASSWEHGWLLALPNRHQLVVHVVQDMTVLGAIQGMARFAHLGYADAPGPLSPHVYWWSGAGYEQLTQEEADGSTAIHVDGRFADVLERLAGR